MSYFNFKYPDQVEKAYAYLEILIQGKKICDIVHKRPLRSNQQNAYLHVLFALFGLEYGWSIEEAKTTVKRELGYVYEKNGTRFLSQTSKMDSKELTLFIDKFRNWSAQNGCYLPSADEYNGRMDYFQNVIEQNKQYL